MIDFLELTLMTGRKELNSIEDAKTHIKSTTSKKAKGSIERAFKFADREAYRANTTDVARWLAFVDQGINGGSVGDEFD